MTKAKDICPNCGSHLILKDGQFGEFLACPRFPDCRFTRPLRDTEELYKPPSPYCEKCNHTGLVPSKALGKFSGKPIPNCWTDCECKLDIPEHYDPVRLQPEDFDFPMSDTFRAFSYQYCGQPDPGFTYPEPVESRPQEIIHRHSDMGKKEFNLLQQTARKTSFLENRLNEHIDLSKKKVIKHPRKVIQIEPRD